MIAQILAFAVLGSAGMGANPGPVTLTLNYKDGDSIAGEVRFRVTVQTDSLVNQVEFYVGDDLRDTKSSTPYEFKLDTLDPNQPEGNIKLTFAAYTTSGDSAKKTLTLKIDNLVGKGADFFDKQGLDLVTNGKYDEAITAARIALKVKPTDSAAKFVLARAYLGKGVLDSAQKYAEDAIAADPTNAAAANLISGIQLRRAFSAFNQGTDKNETLKTIAATLKSAVEARKKVLEGQVDGFGAVTTANVAKYADICIAAGRYSAAITALTPELKRDETNTQLADRLIYAQMRAGRFFDSAQTIAAIQKRGQLDAYGDALVAIQRMTEGDAEGSDAAMKEAILNDPTNVGVRVAQAYIALRRAKYSVLGKLADDLANDAGERPEVNYYLAAVYNAMGRLDEGTQRFERAVLAEPLCYDVYVQRGNDAIALAFRGKLEQKDVDFQYEVAKVFYNTALIAKPESAEALTGLSLVCAYQKKIADSVKYARAATGAGPGYAAGYYALACACSNQEEAYRAAAMAAERDGRHDDAKPIYAQADQADKDALAALASAGKYDVAFLGNIALVPRINDAYIYFVRHGKLPLLTPYSNQ